MLVSRVGFLVALMLLVPAALADEAADYLAAAGDEVRALGDCTGVYTRDHLDSDQSAEAIVDGAFKECDAEVGAMKIALMGDPTHLSDEKATQVVHDVVTQMRDGLVSEVNKRR